VSRRYQKYDWLSLFDEDLHILPRWMFSCKSNEGLHTTIRRAAKRHGLNVVVSVCDQWVQVKATLERKCRAI